MKTQLTTYRFEMIVERKMADAICDLVDRKLFESTDDVLKEAVRLYLAQVQREQSVNNALYTDDTYSQQLTGE